MKLLIDFCLEREREREREREKKHTFNFTVELYNGVCYHGNKLSLSLSEDKPGAMGKEDAPIVDP